jgi:hypothetical protein
MCILHKRSRSVIKRDVIERSVSIRVSLCNCAQLHCVAEGTSFFLSGNTSRYVAGAALRTYQGAGRSCA